jgi:hypothetical protein
MFTKQLYRIPAISGKSARRKLHEILLFLGQRLRVMNQQNAIKIMFKEMDQRCTQKNGRVRDCD